MKKIFILSIIIINFTFVFSKTKDFYQNPFTVGNNTTIKNINFYLFAPSKLIFTTTLPIDYINGIHFGLFCGNEIEVRLSRLFIFKNKIKIGSEKQQLKLKTFDFIWQFSPFYFLNFYLNYKFRDYSIYKIAENNIIFNIETVIPIRNIMNISIVSGFNFRFVDLDIRSNEIKYKEDWYFESFFLWQIKVMVNFLFFYSFGFSIGNIDEFEVFNFNYWQIEFYNYFHLPLKFSLFINGGFAYSGSLPFAGIINRFWVSLGLRYEIKIN